MTGEIIANPWHGIECPHCGCWHYGKGTMAETVQRDAERQVVACEKHRILHGLMDEKPHLLEAAQ